MNTNELVLLVIDAQNDFYTTNAEFEELDKVKMNSVNMLYWARENEIPVIWTFEEHRPDKIDLGIEEILEVEHCIIGTNGPVLIDEMTNLIENTDFLIKNKRRWDAFYGTDLEIILRGLKCKTVIIIGATAGACVIATTFGAKMRDYHTILGIDAIWGSKEHKDSLVKITSDFSKIFTVKQITETPVDELNNH